MADPIFFSIQTTLIDDRSPSRGYIEDAEGRAWIGPILGCGLTHDEITYQLELLGDAITQHGLDPEVMEWAEVPA